MKLLFASSLAAALLAISCSGPKSFEVEGEVAGKPNMNLYVKYYGDGRVASSLALAREGKFSFEGSSQKPAFVEIADNEGRPVAYLCMANGDKVSIVADRANPFKMQAKGSPVMEEWAAVASANAEALHSGTDSAANAAVEAYVLAHPQSMSSSMLLLTAYRTAANPVMADSLARSIAPEARVEGVFDSYVTLLSRYSTLAYAQAVDSLWYRTAQSRATRSYTPRGHERTLLVLTDDHNRSYRRDTIVPALKQAVKDNKKLQIVDLMLCTDTTNFKSATRLDSATWVQGWAPGGIYAKGIDELSIPSLPFYIVLDSAGRQTHRGSSLEMAVEAISPRK